MGEPVKVGIPRALAFYLYYPMWKTFFEELNVSVVPSSQTTKKILDEGARETVSDACVPIKLFHGHVLDLSDKVDYLFIPRLVNVSGSTVFCPKFLGLPDMVRHSLRGIPTIIDTRIDLRRGKAELFKVFYNIGRLFTRNVFNIVRAYKLSLKKLSYYNSLVKEGVGLSDAIGVIECGYRKENALVNSNLTFAIVGYPYNIYDEYVSGDVIHKLQNMGVRVLTPEMFPDRLLNEGFAGRLPKELFWVLSHRAMKVAFHCLDTGCVDGLIHLTAFGCGPDFMVNKFIELEAKRQRSIPFMSLMIDEQTGDAGVLTRLQAFTDMVRMKKRMGVK